MPERPVAGPAALWRERLSFPERKVHLLFVALLAASLYAQILPYGLVWDDPLLLRFVQNEYAREGIRGLLQAEFTINPSQPMGYYRPVVLFSLWADSLLSGVFPWIFHFSNIVLHIACSLLAYILFSLLTPGPRGAFWGALVFAAHPVHVESVAFVSGRTDLWACFFVLLSTLFWARSAQSPFSRRGIFFALSLVAFFMACLSKETAFMLPLVLLPGSLLIRTGDGIRARGFAVRNLAWIAGWAACIAVVMLLRSSALGSAPLQLASADTPGHGDMSSVPSHLLPGIWATYLRLLTLPWPLNAYYTAGETTLNVFNIAGAALLIAVFAVLSFTGNKRKGLFSLLWIAVFLLPVSGLLFIRGALAAERFLYLPSVGFALAIGLLLGCTAAGGALKKPVRVLFLVYVLALCGGTLARSTIWRDPLTFFSTLTATSPNFVQGYNELGIIYKNMGRYTEAMDYSGKALSLRPRFPEAHVNLGNVFLAQRDYTRASEHFEKALELNPGLGEAYLNLGAVHGMTGDFSRSIDILQKGLGHLPNDPELHFNLGLSYFGAGRPKKAEEEYRILTRLSPDRAEVLRRTILEGKRQRGRL